MATPLIGQMIGQYRLIGLLGQGGMSSVYKAYHPRLERFVAIKMVAPTMTHDREFMTRFEREARLVGRLEHPNVVPVYDFSEHNGQPYLVMKYIEGLTLKQALSDGALVIEDILTLMTPIASALDHAHERGILHRDIKPSNILLDLNGTPYLSDFGLARTVHPTESTHTGDFFLGTPHYVAPEQAEGAGTLTRQADLYSLGVVLYELVVGRVPFNDGTPYKVVHDHINTPVPPPHTLNPTVPPAVEAVLLKALAKTPDERHASAGALIDALRGALTTADMAALNQAMRQSVSTSILRSQDLSAVRQTSQMFTLDFAMSELTTQRQATPLPMQRARRLRWGIAGLIVVLLMAAALVVASRALTPPGRASIPLTRVPIAARSLDEARAALVGSPNDAAARLSLARAFLIEGWDADAQRVVMEGAAFAPEPTAYFLSAADEALKSGRGDAAFNLYAEALMRLPEDADAGTTAAVRADVGERLYGIAATAGLVDSLQMRRLNTDSRIERAPVVGAMVARALVTDGRYQIAQIAVTRLVNANRTLPEARLVRGDLLFARGDITNAEREWQAARANPNAPLWVRERAERQISRRAE